jgi:CTP synthase
MEAIRQMLVEMGPGNALSMHVTLVPYIAAAGELKTKPTQHSVKALREIGIQPDILLCRTEKTLEDEHRNKIALFCNLNREAVIEAKDINVIYGLPSALQKQGLDELVCRLLNIWSRPSDMSAWDLIVERIINPREAATIGVIGKYVHLQDAYKSLNEALVHGGIANNCKVKLKHINAEDIEENGAEPYFKDIDGLLIPGGFGERGTEGKIAAIQYARENSVPFFGICLGLQMAVIEYARNKCGIKKATSEEFDENAADKVIHFMADQKHITKKGATMRLGAYPCTLDKDSVAAKIYGSVNISERHRHRYEVNNDYRVQLEKSGLQLCGLSPDGVLVEMIELADHPYFVACQFHPEFKSRPGNPHPLFSSFIKACLAASKV